MNKLNEFFMECEKHFVMRAHATLFRDAQNEWKVTQDKISILQLENLKGQSVLEDKNEEILKLRKAYKDAKTIIATIPFESWRLAGEWMEDYGDLI
jgi:hypothetical protein